MKNKFILTYILKCAAALLLTPSMLASCTGKPTPAEPSKTVGVGRAVELVIANAERNEVIPEGITPVVDEQPPLENSGESADGTGSGTSAGGISWKYENGKYTYNFPEPDRSSLSDLTDINNTSRAFFDDVNPDDPGGTWYFSPTSVDPTTGETIFLWNKDRSDTTLALLDQYGGIYRGDTSKKVCYLTFDCGYENGYTGKIIDTLNEKGVSGTFFVTGDYIKEAPELIERMYKEGHIVGNHTLNHLNMTQQTAEDFISQIEGVEQMVKAVYPDAPPMLYYRPPEGAANEWALKLADKMGLRTVLWSYTYKDYVTTAQLDTYTALEKLKGGLHPGCVYLMHAVSSTNAAVLGDLIDWIKGQGYEILPLCDIDMNKE